MGEKFEGKNIIKTKNMSKYLADTTVLVEMLRGNIAAKQFLESLPEISKVTLVELIQGCQDKKDLQVVEKACNFLPQIKIDEAISNRAIELLKEYRLSHGLLFLDALIAATCILRKNILVTQNIKDFKFISGLTLLSQEEAFQL